MAAAYDTYDYPSYWIDREYEHKAEVIAIREFLTKINKIKTILEIGAGYGRLVDSYSFRAKKIIISDPSAKLLKLARNKFRNTKKYTFVHSTLKALPSKIRSGSIDLIILVRVLHHLKDLNESISIIRRLLKKGGCLILEYPNKRHWKSVTKEFLHGNFTFPLDIFPKDLRSKKSIKQHKIPFYNYHPDKIEDILNSNDLYVVENRSVSNLRSNLLKKILSQESLLQLEKTLQIPLSTVLFGPSIFILAQKRG